MLLVTGERTWTFGLCSMYILHNTILVDTSNTERSKDSLFHSDKIFQKSYNFEDFFWTGSGDGSFSEDAFHNVTDPNAIIIQPSSIETWRTTTVFHTTTILFATVYPNQPGCAENECFPQVTPVQTGSIDFSFSTYLPPNVPDVRPSSAFDTLPSVSSTSPHTFLDKNKTKGTTNEVEVTTSTSLKHYTPQFIVTSNFGSEQRNQSEDSHATKTTVFPENSLEPKFWLLTVLKNDTYLPNLDLNLTENKLSSLYQQAFNRRLESYLGENDLSYRRDHKILQPTRVRIWNVTQVGNDIGIIYSILVGGKPIPAIAAANDMRLMSTSEVIAELGRPILTKAEPYIKVAVQLGARVKGRTRDTWVLIGCVSAAIFLLLFLVGLLALILSKKQTRKSSTQTSVQVEEEKGTRNLAFDNDDTDLRVENVIQHSQKSNLKLRESTKENEFIERRSKFKKDDKKGSSPSSSCSGSSEAGLVRFRNQKIKRDCEERPKSKFRTRDRKIQSSDPKNGNNRRAYILSAGSAVSKNTFDDSVLEEYSPYVLKSPTSYLSMPSVKAFPRGAKITEPLNKILEPTIIRHLDADSDSPRPYNCSQNRHVEVEIEQVCEVKNKFVRGKSMTRHASLEGDDPGFIGPVVWNRHCEKIMEKDGVIINDEEYENVNVGRRRKRFNELLDDALSMFGSKSGSPEGNNTAPVKKLDSRIHSAVMRQCGLSFEESASCRPNTTGSKRPQSSVVSGPKGAWDTPSCSTLGRPLSAEIFHETSPKIDKNLIYANTELSPSDPAIPLIAAIKTELKKFDDSPNEQN